MVNRRVNATSLQKAFYSGIYSGLVFGAMIGVIVTLAFIDLTGGIL